MRDYEGATAFLGEWGRFQQQVFFLLCLIVVPNGFNGVAVVFLVDTPAHRCLVPARLNLSAAWRNSSIPLLEEAEGGPPLPSRCLRYRAEDLLDFSRRGLLPGVDVNLTEVPTEGCVDGWEYDQSLYTSTIVTEWNLVCDDRWKNPMTSSVFFFGVLAGSVISGQLSDRYGRKIVLFVTIAARGVFSLIQIFSPSWPMYCALFFIVGMGHISVYLSAFVLGTELLGPRVRIYFSTLGVCLFFGIGYMLLPAMAYLFRDWKTLTLALNLPGLVFLLMWWFIPESPRWLLSRGRVEEAEALVREAAKTNGIQPPAVIFSCQQDKRQSEPETTHNICDLLRSPNIRGISLTLWLIWNTLTISYFSISLNTANLHGDPFFNCFLSAMVEIPAYILSWVLFRWFSRRLSIFSTFTICGLSLFFIQLTPADLHGLAITLEMTGKFAISAAFAIVYAYTVELYPTVLRNTAVGTCSMASRIGSIVAPYFIYLRSYSVSLPYILMGSVTTLAGLLSLLLPESYGMPLPDTISHMQIFPGCCHKKKYTAAPTEEDAELSAERKAPAVA